MDVSPLGHLARFSTISNAEKINVYRSLGKPLSGYLGGINEAGYWVTRLQNEWCEAFRCKYAVACNSATSGLLAACMAIGVGPGDEVWTTAYSMSATAACAKVLGAHIVFIDIEWMRLSMNLSGRPTHGHMPKCIIVTNLFGHPAYLTTMRSWCDSNNVIMIEDNAQSPFALEEGKYAGTVGHIGVFSLNVHKHIQCGEGGVCVTSSASLAEALAGAVNHGELNGGNNRVVGLNLRMTEPIAAIACAQLKKAPSIIEGRRQLALEITSMFDTVPWISPPGDAAGCKHVYYMWCATIDTKLRRARFLLRMRDMNVPFRRGYSPTLNRVFHTNQVCPVAEQMEDERLISFEICAYDPKTRHLKKIREIIKRATGEIE